MNIPMENTLLDPQPGAIITAQFAKTPPAETASRVNDELLQELQMCQIEMDMQNEELRQAQTDLEESRDRYMDLYEFAPVGYLTLTAEGLISKINLTGAARLGAERRNLLHQRFACFISPEDKDHWTRHFMGVKKHGGQSKVELALQNSGGQVFHAQLDCVCEKNGANDALRHPGGHSLDVRITLTDISERKLAEELRIAAIAFASQGGMVITDPQGVILRVNPAFTRLTGYSAEEAIGQTPALLKSKRHDPLFYQRMWDSLIGNGYWQGEIWNKRKNGEIYPELLSITAITTPDRGLTHYIGSFYDITESKNAEAEIHRLAFYDPLTHLPNRRLLQDRLTHAIATSERSRRYGAICFIDLDNFKALNDTRGHDAGDLLLVEVAQRLRMVVRESDTVARQGGDEFVVLLENLDADMHEATAQAKLLGEKLHSAIEKPFNLRGHEYHCKISTGISLFHGKDTAEELFKHADLALYQAKNAGRNGLRFFDPGMKAALALRNSLEAELRQALKHDQLQLYYQPQVDAARRMIGVEALLRWQHPKRGLVVPDDFIPLAEDTGLILPIGIWVLETVCNLLKTWEEYAWTRALPVAVNISVRQFRQPGFVDQVQRILETSGANPARLKLELTENLVLQNVENTIEKMQAIKQLGVHFSMGDFGTGYSSLSYLAQLPINELKIDKSFVRNLPGRRNDATIARTIITMGQGLKMDIIAEGVETEAQREFLESHGCHAYQGYLFSEPLPLATIEELVNLV